jgi:hypothetical protein
MPALAISWLVLGCNGRPNGTAGPNDDDGDGGGSPGGSGRIEVTVAVTASPPGASYVVTISNGQKRTVGPNETAAFTTSRTGTHEVAISSVPSACTLAEQNPQIITVHQSETVAVGFSITCPAQQ